MALVVCKTQKENDEIAVDAKERQRFVRGVVKDLVSSFILLTLRQFLYTLSITDEDKKRLCNKKGRRRDEGTRVCKHVQVTIALAGTHHQSTATTMMRRMMRSN